MKRRDFLKAAAAAGTVLATARADAADAQKGEPARAADHGVLRNGMLYRKLGSTGVEVSAIGVGGHHIGIPADAQLAIQIIRTALDRGITFLDNSWDYHEGESERRMGKALLGGYRAKAFLMTKIDGRTRQAAARQLDECLARLQTDHIDLVQHHEVIRLEDPDRIFEEGGGHEALEAARKAGKIRFIGFTGHKDPMVHLRMLEVARAHGVQFDTVQMPLNVMDAHFRSFEKMVLPVLVRERIGVLGMKSLGSGDILKSGAATAIECLHYALNLPTSVVISGMESLANLDQAFEAIRTFKPLTGAEISALLARTAKHAATGKFEQFKTNTKFDATAKNPTWLG